jgi:hypothetical protein
MKNVVIQAEAYVDASVVLSSPATALFNRLVELRGEVVMAFSEWLRGEIVRGLEQRGLAPERAQGQADFIVSLGTMFEVKEGIDPLAALALAAGTDVAYVVRDSGATVDGVRMAPIHELITSLEVASVV